MSEEIDKIRQTLIERARKEANEVIEKAREKARRIIEEALRQRERKIQQVGQEIMGNAKRKAEEEILAVKIEARKEITNVKNEVLKEIWSKVISKLREGEFDRKESLKRLLLEALNEIPVQKVIIYVREEDKGIVKEILSEISTNKEVIDIRSCNILGGVIVESEDSLIRIDNSYDTRLSSIKYRYIHNIFRKIFGVE